LAGGASKFPHGLNLKPSATAFPVVYFLKSIKTGCRQYPLFQIQSFR